MKSYARSCPEDPERELAARTLARRNLLDFTTYTFPQYEPEAAHALIARSLEAVAKGEVPRLMVFAPPQHGKSELVSVRLPAFWLGQRPDDPVILCSYAASLAHNHSRQSRTVVESPAFARLSPEVRTSQGSRAVDHWQIAGHRGGLLAAGVGGPITGHGAALGIIDDPVENWQQAQSQTVRDATWDWYRTTFRTRIWEQGAIIIIMTRWHQDDLAARLLMEQSDQWTILRLPALSEGEGDPLGRPEGEPLCPGRFSRAALEEIRRDIGPLAWAAEYQGTPRAQEGALFQIDKFPLVDSAPPGLRTVRFWDLAVSAKHTADFTVGAKLGVDRDGHWWLLHLVRGRWTWPEARRVIARTALLDTTDVWQGVEDVAFQRAAYDDLVSLPELGSIRFELVRPVGDKFNRAAAWAGRVYDGLFHLVRGEWVRAFLDECSAFPAGRHDDMVDAVSGGVQMLTGALERPMPWMDPLEALKLAVDRQKSRSPTFRVDSASAYAARMRAAAGRLTYPHLWQPGERPRRGHW